MSNKPKRRCQIHLSTVIVMMLLGAVILGLNVLPHSSAPKDIQEIVSYASMEYVFSKPATFTYGWPMRFIISDLHAFCGSEYAPLLNIVVGVALVVVLGVAMEYLIRRREARKP